MPEHSQEKPWRCSLDLLAESPPETAWLIEGLLPTASVMLFSGREGTMKTWLALDWARAVAEGTPWLGHECAAGAVLYLDAEMPHHLFRDRLHGVGGSPNLNVWRWQDNVFPTQLNDALLLEAAKSHRLLVVDTLKRFMGNLEENSSTDMAQITAGLRQLTRWGATVVALHHAAKDQEKPGYRGSTELGAGVDIALNVERSRRDGKEMLQLITHKTRYVEELQLSLQVERPGPRPAFLDATEGRELAAQRALRGELDQLRAVILALHSANGQPPNQSQIIEEAHRHGLGSRNTILRWLTQGEGDYWRSVPDGRSRIYESIVHSSNRPESGEQDSLNNTPASLPNLSTCPRDGGKDSLDEWTGRPMVDHALRQGTGIRFIGKTGVIETGIIEAAVEWPGYPEEVCYMVAGRVIPPNRIQGIGGNS